MSKIAEMISLDSTVLMSSCKRLSCFNRDLLLRESSHLNFKLKIPIDQDMFEDRLLPSRTNKGRQKQIRRVEPETERASEQ